MISKTALIAVLALLLNSGGLLLCQWECLNRESAHHATTSCHTSQDDRPAFQTGPGHDCLATSAVPPTTSAKSVESAKHRFAISVLRLPITTVAAAIASPVSSPPGSPHLAPSRLIVVLRI